MARNEFSEADKHKAVALVRSNLLTDAQSARAIGASPASIQNWKDNGYGDVEEMQGEIQEHEEAAEDLKSVIKLFKRS